ncbi:imidazole glycerol phosphate synthase subunit HisH [Mucilaginibacter sp.]|uniref:imidazole glycerol phosphate synthase subunit HisH n=1 Tax=Mucilaginibacter sp. TaxID=1882438 RepID=UPI0035BC0B33
MDSDNLQQGKSKAPASVSDGRIGIIRYGAGNIFSLTATLERLGIGYGMVNTEADLEQYDRYIIPGVGHAGAAMNKLESTGLIPAIKALKKPTLGICVGMQLLTSYSEEGDASLLNLFPVRTLKFPQTSNFKVPHTGWNQVFTEKENPLFKNIPVGSHFYFVHSYFIEYDQLYTLSSTSYINKFSASIWHNNFYGVQFHPEKSGLHGETLLKNFSTI